MIEGVYCIDFFFKVLQVEGVSFSPACTHYWAQF